MSLAPWKYFPKSIDRSVRTSTKSRSCRPCLVRSSAAPGLELIPSRTIAERAVAVDTLLVAGGPNIQTHDLTVDEARWIKTTTKKARRYGSICSGAFIMAQTGLFAGKRVTTHWSNAADLAKKFPELKLEADAIFICDRPVCTSAVCGHRPLPRIGRGICGRTVALDTARELVVYLRRSGGQSQFSTHLSAQMSSVPAIEAIQIWVSENLKADLSVDALAKRSGMSARNFSRIFLKETGVTPRDFVEGVRIDAARRPSADNVPLQRAATQAGFGTVSNLRRAFFRRLMTTPSTYRDNFGKEQRAGTG